MNGGQPTFLTISSVIHVSEHEVYFQNFRENSVYSVMICEDLARSEPCHDLLRAVASNLLFVLLMVGPQTPTAGPLVMRLCSPRILALQS